MFLVLFEKFTKNIHLMSLWINSWTNCLFWASQSLTSSWWVTVWISL